MELVDAGELLAKLEAGPDPFPGLKPEAIERVPMDVVAGIPPDKSKLEYGEPELKYRASIEAWYAQNPDAGLDIPFDAADDELKIPEDD